MALSRRTDRRTSHMVWPGFVDAMTALLLVVMFVLSIFMIVQFTLRETISDTQRELDTLGAQLAALSNTLAMEQARSEDLAGEVGRLNATLADARTENARLDALALALTAERDQLAERASTFEERVAALIAERDAARADVGAARAEATQRGADLAQAQARISTLEAASARAVSEQEALQAALARLRDEVDAEKETARLAAARRAALEALVEQLRAEAARSEDQASTAARAMDEAERNRLLEAAAAEALRKRLRDADAELSAMTLVLEEERRKAEETLTKLAAAEAARRDLSLDLDETASTLERERALLALARDTAAKSAETNTDQARQLAALNAQTRELRRQLAALQSQLEASESADEASKVEITNLGQRLNAALAREAALKAREAERLRAENRDLASYRSEFFGRMRQILAGREDIRIVGDRFVFQSEVLFDVGSAALGAAGRAELANLAQAIREVAPEVPEGIDWILRVDGHTDSRGSAETNWRLSLDRAYAVVRYLVEVEGLPPERLSANGFAQYQPIDSGTSEAAYARNRRIEVKFTER